MDKKVITVCAVAAVTLIILPELGYATTGDDLLGKEFVSKAESLKTTLLGWPLKLAAILGVANAGFQAMMGSSPKVIFTWIAAAVITSIIPSLLDSLFATGALTP